MNLLKIVEDSVFKPHAYFKRIYEKHNIPWEEINIFGVRHEEDQESDLFNDVIGIVTDNDISFFSGTTDPGAYWTKMGGANEKKNGCAHLYLGYHSNAYMVGYHRGKQALVQTGDTVKIWRDVNKNFVNDERISHIGYFGINIHRAAPHNVTNKIGRWSAGCQVIRSDIDFCEFMSIITKSDTYIKSNKSQFGYFLMDEKMMEVR